jgi:hypothetical protein
VGSENHPLNKPVTDVRDSTAEKRKTRKSKKRERIHNSRFTIWSRKKSPNWRHFPVKVDSDHNNANDRSLMRINTCAGGRQYNNERQAMPTTRNVFLAAIVSGLAVVLLQPTAGAEEFVRLTVFDGRYSLVAPNGKPFFPHGVNHISASGRGEDATRVAKTCRELGFNAYGYGTPEELHGDMPYIESWNDLVPISTHRGANSFGYRDIFDEAVQADIRQKIKEKCDANRDNKNLIGYMWTDLPAWTLDSKHGTNWVEFCRELPAGAAGKQAYTSFLKSDYEDVDAVNAVYETNAMNWEQLGEHSFASVPKTGAVKSDDLQFLRRIAREYYTLLGNTTRKHDPNHLVFGDRFMFSLVVDEVLDEMLPHVDAIAIQPLYKSDFPRATFKALHERTDKPIIISDFAIRFRDGNNEVRGGQLVYNDDIAGQEYAAYLRNAIDAPHVIGAFWCNWQDSIQPNKPGVKQGLFGSGGKTRPNLKKHIKGVNRYRDEVTQSHRSDRRQTVDDHALASVATKNASSLEIDLDHRRPLSQDVYGANNECLFRPVWFDHPAYAEKYISTGRPFFRFPGGTGSNFYNPFTGYYDDDSPSTRDYSGHNQRISQFTKGKGRVPDEYLRFAKRHDVRYSLVLNVCTQTFEQNKTWLEQLGRDGHKIAAIEIGNEVFYGGYTWAFPTAADYVERAKKLTAVIRDVLPETKVGVVIPNQLYQDARILTDERPPSLNHPYGWIKELDGETFFDAIVMHVYSLTGMSNATEPTDFIPHLEGYKNCESELDRSLDKTLGTLTKMFPGKSIWMTEFGVGGFGGNLKQYGLRYSHLGALHTDVMLMRFIKHPAVNIVHWHSFQHFFDFVGGEQGIGDHEHLTYTHFSLFKDAIRNSNAVVASAIKSDRGVDDIELVTLVGRARGYAILLNRGDANYALTPPAAMSAGTQLTHRTDMTLSEAMQDTRRCEKDELRMHDSNPVILPPYSITRLEFKL